MSQMKELYDKVAHDNTLQMKFFKIIENQEHLSAAEVGGRQEAFAKELGYDVTKEEIDALGLYCALASADEEAKGRGCTNLFK